MALTEQSGISVAEIIIYTPALSIALWLSIRHGFKRSSGWIYLLLFSTVRIVGSALQLAAASSSPPNVGLYIGAATLQTIGLTPLILALLGLLGRALESIRRTAPNFPLSAKHLRLTGLVVTVALILGSIGASQARQAMSETGQYEPGSLSKAGTALTIVAYVLLAASTALCGLQSSHAEPGEKRLLLAIAAALPFLLVRLIFAALTTFSNSGSFSMMNGSVNVRLGMAIIMEMVVVAIIEGIGLTVQKRPSPMTAEHGPLRQSDEDTSYPMEEGQQWKYSNRSRNRAV